MTKRPFNVQPESKNEGSSVNVSLVTGDIKNVHVEDLHHRPGIKVVWPPPQFEDHITTHAITREYKVTVITSNGVFASKSPDSGNTVVVFEDYYDHIPIGGARILIEVFINGHEEASGYIIIEDIAQRVIPYSPFFSLFFKAVRWALKVFRIGKIKVV